MVPLIGEALDAVREALDAAGDGKKPEHTALFPTFLKYNGRGVDKLSERACTAIRTAGVPKSKRITANSFRHSFKAALRSAKVEEFLHRRLMGHSGEGVADNYGSPEAMLDELRDSLEAAIPYLGDVNPMIYSSDEKMV
jgi:integrase